jgi:hypothetical protein
MAKNLKYFTVQERNEWFEKLSPARKRVQIAKDVIAQIQANKIVPTNSIYFDLNFRLKDLDGQKLSLQNILIEKPDYACRCCAKGAMFVAKAEKYNQCDVLIHEDGDCHVYNEEISENLSDIFSLEQLGLIESAFEATIYYYDGDYDKHRIASRMFQPTDDSKDRMIMIMENIIFNKGTFVPYRTG